MGKEGTVGDKVRDLYFEVELYEGWFPMILERPLYYSSHSAVHNIFSMVLFKAYRKLSSLIIG